MKKIENIEWEDISYKYEEEEENIDNDLWQDVWGGQIKYDADIDGDIYIRPRRELHGKFAYRHEFWNQYARDIWG